MKDVKEQKIAVPLSFGDSDRNAILNGIKIASIFRKELCLLYNYNKKEEADIEHLSARLEEYTLPIKNEIPGFPVSTLLVSEQISELPDKLADDYEVILFVAFFGLQTLFKSAGRKSGSISFYQRKQQPYFVI